LRLRRWLEALWWRPRLAPEGWWLVPLSSLYQLIVAVRQALAEMGWRRPPPGAVPVPVVVVGNLIVGGAGKTPTTLAVVQGLQERGWHPGIVSRGYGGSRREPGAVHGNTDPTACGDEPLLLRRRSSVPVWTGRSRVAAAQALCAAHPDVDILVADDGLQHLALARCAQVIVFDGRGAGNRWCLPAGPLRQRLTPEPPPRSVVVYNAAEPSVHWPGHCAQRGLGRLSRLSDWWAPDGRGAGRPWLAPESLNQGRLRAAAGIAEPERFFVMLERLGLRLDERWPLADHAPLSPRPWPDDGATTIVTEKDAVKLAPDSTDAGHIVVATLDFGLPPGFWAELEPLLPARRRAVAPLP